MLILRNQLLRIGLAVLVVSGCAVLNRQVGDDSDAENGKQKESGLNDVNVIPEDAAYDSQLESGRGDVSVIPVDAATDAALGADTSMTNTCRVVDLEENDADAAVVDAMVPTEPTISGMIIDNGDCLSGVQVCMMYRYRDSSSPAIDSTAGNAASTNQYGVFELSVPSESSSLITLTPRKAGYRFKPSSLSLNESITDAGVSGLSFIATAVDGGLPEYATGKWRVVEVNCFGVGNCAIPDIIVGSPLETLYKYVYNTYNVGDTLTFENGCLFGGADCVEGTHYSDENAFCRGFVYTVPLASSTVVRTGEYVPETQSWQISINLHACHSHDCYDVAKQIILKQESSSADTGR
jgi:hypothetical protein